MRKKVLLYNPKTVFYDMPLALLAIGSVLDVSKYEVVIIDGRISENVEDEFRKHLPDALCVGITVITGAPIKDALYVSDFVKTIKPSLPVIWGGWHTSLFPKQPLEDHTCIDVTVQGQGEQTFQELVEALSAQTSLSGIKGITYRVEGEVRQNPVRNMTPMQNFGSVNYDLIDVEAYFKKKGKRQFDYISSTGCFFRCSFCADPFVFQRKFTAISGEKMGEELAYFHAKYKFTDLNFQDETFFTYSERIEAFAKELINRKIDISWAATMRADQGERLGDEIWELCRKSGLRRLLIGVESGSQEMMDWLKKDIKLPQVFFCADKCKDLGIAAIFPFIVGFPDESEYSIAETVKVIKLLRSKSEYFQTPIFYFKPYPGSSITEEVVKKGYELPTSTKEWGDFDYIGSSGPWVSAEKERFFEAFKFYLKLGYGDKKSVLTSPLRKIARWRCEKENFSFPLEKVVIETLRPQQKLS